MIRRTLLILLVIVPLATTGRADAAVPRAESAMPGVLRVSAGSNHSCAIVVGGQVWCWGSNEYGQAGGDTLNAFYPEPVRVSAVSGSGPLTGATQISAGDDHTCARLSSGRAVCWGRNDNHQLGDGHETSRSRPDFVLFGGAAAPMENVVQVTAGRAHSCAVLTSEIARCWGANASGQVGDASFGLDAFTARTVRGVSVGTATLTEVTQIDAGNNTTCALLSLGAVRCWGSGVDYQLGNGSTTTHQTRPVAVRGVTTAFLSGAKEVRVGTGVACARDTGGHVVCWGNGGAGALGDGTRSIGRRPGVVLDPAGDDFLSGVTTLDVGENHVCAALASQLRCWGQNLVGELGVGFTSTAETLPLATRNVAGTAPLKNVVAVAAGRDHTCALLSIQQVRCWGTNDSDQLGDASSEDQWTPVVVLDGVA